MNDIFNILKLRRLIVVRVLSQSRLKDRLTAVFVFLLLLAISWRGAGGLLEKLSRNFDARMFDKAVWWIIIIIGIGFFAEGTISAIKRLYKHPENDFLLSLPINLKNFFYERWIEQFIRNSWFILASVLVLLQYLRFSTLSGAVFALLFQVLLTFQQLQFVFAMLLSRRIIGNLKDGLYMVAILAILATSIVCLAGTESMSLSMGELICCGIINIALLLTTFLSRRLFATSFHREYRVMQSAGFRRKYSFHRLFGKGSLGFRTVKVKTLVIKDIILFLRQLPISLCLLTVAAVVAPSLVMRVQGDSNAPVIFGAAGSLIIFLWTLYIFNFEDKQAGQMWMLRACPLSSKQIWWSKFVFLFLLSILTCLLFFTPFVFRVSSFGESATYSAIILAQGVILSFIAVGILYISWPYFKVGQYMYVFLLAIIFTIAAIFMFPPLLALIMPVGIANYMIGINRIKQMEL